MKITYIGTTSPNAKQSVTPELLASCLAKYSRSNEGIDAILSKVDLTKPDESIEKIFQFIDYGHQSIAGLTGGIAVAMDDVSMWLAYKLFSFLQVCLLYTSRCV